MMGGLVGRYEPGGDGEEYELAEPDEVLNRYSTILTQHVQYCLGTIQY